MTKYWLGLNLDYSITWTSKANYVSDYGNRLCNYMNNEGGQDLFSEELNAQNVVVDSVMTTLPSDFFAAR